LLRKWEETWSLPLASPDGGKTAALFNRAVPKSQVVAARKSAKPLQSS
jgi:hypothetical protein